MTGLTAGSWSYSNIRTPLQRTLLPMLESKDHEKILISVELWIWRSLREIAAITLRTPNPLHRRVVFPRREPDMNRGD